MSRFTAATYEITADRQRGRPIVCLTSRLDYEVGFLGSGWVISAPVGFCTDLASVPRWTQRFAWGRRDLASVPRWTQRFAWGRRLARKLARSAIVHDLLRADRRVPKLTGDIIFSEALGVDQVRFAWRVVAFIGVLLNFTRGQ